MRCSVPGSLRGVLVTLAAAVVLAPGVGVAEDQKFEAYAVPDTPATTYLNASPQQVQQPGGGRALLAQVLSNISSDGSVQHGFAFGSQLWFLLPRALGGTVAKDAFRTMPGYAWSRLMVSGATLRSASVTSATDIALGLRTTLVDEGDPLTIESRRIRIAQIRESCLESEAGEPLPAAESQRCADDKTKEEKIDRATFLREHWNATRLSIAGATGWRLADSRIQQGSWLGWAAWVTGGVALGKVAQVIGQLRYDDRAPSNAHVVGGGVRLVVGSPAFNGFGEALYSLGSSVAPGADPSEGRWALGLEYRINEQLWVSTSLGSTFATAASPNRIGVLSTLKWNLGDEAQLSPFQEPS